MGCIEEGFHFLGINYPGTRLQDNMKAHPAMRMHLHSQTVQKAQLMFRRIAPRGSMTSGASGTFQGTPALSTLIPRCGREYERATLPHRKRTRYSACAASR